MAQHATACRSARQAGAARGQRCRSEAPQGQRQKARRPLQAGHSPPAAPDRSGTEPPQIASPLRAVSDGAQAAGQGRGTCPNRDKTRRFPAPFGTGTMEPTSLRSSARALASTGKRCGDCIEAHKIGPWAFPDPGTSHCLTPEGYLLARPATSLPSADLWLIIPAPAVLAETRDVVPFRIVRAGRERALADTARGGLRRCSRASSIFWSYLVRNAGRVDPKT